ncbi:MAG: hypothetical protein JXA93_12995 [Anaerolineae bacterium]|nr:hypothetical protein [Anaerolineae bacterium]
MEDLLEGFLVELLEEEKAFLDLASVRADVREELEPLVRAALDLRVVLRPKVPGATRARIEQRILASREVARLKQPARSQARESRPRILHWRFALLSALLFTLLFSLVAVHASAEALPGSGLYGVKRASEAAWLWFTPRNDRGSVHLSLADRRLHEFEALLDQGTWDEEILAEIGQHVEAALVLAETMPPALAAPLLEEVMAVGAQQEGRLTDLLATAPPSSRARVAAAIRVHRRWMSAAAARFEILSAGAGRPLVGSGTPAATGAGRNSMTAAVTSTRTGTAAAMTPGRPSASPVATAVPGAGELTPVPESATQEPVEQPEPTDTPGETGVAEATNTPRPSSTPQLTDTPRPSSTPQLTDTPRPSSTPKLTDTPVPTETRKPTHTPKPTNTHRPPEVPIPTKTPKPEK